MSFFRSGAVPFTVLGAVLKRALVIDGSVFARRNFTIVLEGAGYEVTTASNARNGLRMVASMDLELITLDMGLSDMKGLDCLDQINASCDKPVVVTAEPGEHSDAMSKAVRLHGAAAAVQKPSAWDVVHNARGVADLVRTISQAAQVRKRPARAAGLAPKPNGPARTAPQKPMQSRASASGPVGGGPNRAPSPGRPAAPRMHAGPNFPIFLVGSSTGGPNALQVILPKLPADFPAAIVIAQHMPKRFTAAFAARMSGMMAFPAHEAASETEIKAGNCYIATGGSDCVISSRGGKVFAGPQPPEEGSLWCPSVDRLVESAMRAVPAKRLRAVQLTGIGNDGARAMTALFKQGSSVIAESKESSVVFGMPGNLISMGGATKVLHQKDIAKAMLAILQK